MYKKDIQKTVRILDEKFEYDYILWYDYLDTGSFLYDFDRGLVDYN